MKNVTRFIIAFVPALGVVAFALFLSSSNISSWYDSISKPFFAPPYWLYAPVWTLLYVLTGFVIMDIWDKEESETLRRWLFVFFIQTAMSALWATLFFRLHSTLLSSLEAIFLWIAVVILTVDTSELDKQKLSLMLLYFVWMTYACLATTVGVWWVN
jgi:benzodiazapine receptor